MQIKVRPDFFLNELTIEFKDPCESSLTALLKDENGTICRSLQVDTHTAQSYYKWYGLSELPYGVYTCEISGDSEQIKTQLVKR